MEKFLEELKKFPDRERNLRDITRYSLYDSMWYRTNLWTHSRRVAWIVEELSLLAQEVFGDSFDSKKAYIAALVHDDTEMIIGDIQAGNKAKMEKAELNKLDILERNAADDLAAKSPQYIGGYEYKELLYHAIDKDSLEAMVIDWADKFDAFCEALHEIFAGNTSWTKNVVNEYGTILLPTDYYMNYFNKFKEKFPQSAPLFEKHDPIFTIPTYPAIEKLIVDCTDHTEKSIHQKTGYMPYDLWISLTLKKGTDEDIKNLYIRKE